MKKGELFNIHGYKHSGKLYKVWDEAILLEETDEYYVFGNKNTRVTKLFGKSWNTKETAITVVPNNVYDGKYTVTFYKNDVDANGVLTNAKALKGKTVAIETNSSSIEVNKESAVTNTQGKIDFKVAASVEGDYEIDFTVDGVTWTVYVTVTNTSATYRVERSISRLFSAFAIAEFRSFSTTGAAALGVN